jgi:hypothetical protein
VRSNSSSTSSFRRLSNRQLGSWCARRQRPPSTPPGAGAEQLGRVYWRTWARWSKLPPRPRLVLALGLEAALGERAAAKAAASIGAPERPWPGAPLVAGAASEAVAVLKRSGSAVGVVAAGAFAVVNAHTAAGGNPVLLLIICSS